MKKSRSQYLSKSQYRFFNIISCYLHQNRYLFNSCHPLLIICIDNFKFLLILGHNIPYTNALFISNIDLLIDLITGTSQVLLRICIVGKDTRQRPILRTQESFHYRTLSLIQHQISASHVLAFP